ncbi:hypothetical protein ACFQGX_45225 [Nonomuraea dietziae]|uniref:hypothetical protein n=1 Tax=Nonomuraea dietziae TaxID=65515 RepID=UPI003611656B
MSGPRGAVGGAAEWEAPITVAELVNGGPLAGARMYGAGESPVHQVRIVDELAVFSSVAPHTAVVLIGAAASGGWAVEMAMRRAWEQAAACVIAPVGAVGAGSSAVLSDRLGITLVFVTADPLVTAVEVASAAARPAAARTQLVARCATRLAEAGASARRVLGVLNTELPGTSVAFVDETGTRLAGRAAALSSGAASGGTAVPASGLAGRDPAVPASGLGGRGPAVHPAGLEGRGPAVPSSGPAGRGPVAQSSGIVGAWPAEVVVRGPAGEVLGRLVAGGPARSAGWPSVVRTVLELAVAPLAAWAATERLAAAGDFALQSALAERLLSEAASGSENLEDAAGSEVPGSLGGLEASDASDVPGNLGGLRDSAASDVPGDLGRYDDPDGSEVPGDLGGFDGCDGPVGPDGFDGAEGSESPAGSKGGSGARLSGGAGALGAPSGSGRLRGGRPGRRADDRRAGEGVWARAVALGWAVRGPVSAFMVRPSGWTADRQDSPRAGEVIAATLGGAPVVRRGDGWAGWSALEPGELAERLGACLRALPWPCAAGVGTPVTGLRAVGESLLGAEAAAFLAGSGRVARSDRLGPAELLAAIPGGVLRAPATVVLRPLMAADREGTLLETLGPC